ncbi:hypothetical protein BDM02DRAFT_3268758 [Thelephora ganbajun]|uniref:Uncharacterized protein n=1 Tax=Thelephora ganbajun TaxID=370292 RepID=A0ACB6ZI23_THEGA|nr:hypothetical protein BDM02DRAFT_3268758 [Thelephora ganbajun]
MPPPPSTSTGTHLTTSRIHRILRPLKTKCAGLASTMVSAVGKSTGGVRVTYGSRTRISRTNSSSFSSSNSDELPPLAILPPPGQMHHSRSTSQYDSTGKQLALSKNIYGIRDAFKNVINIAFGCGSDEPHTRSSGSSAVSVDCVASSSKRRVVSLAGLCAIVVGKELGVGQEGDREDEENTNGDEEGEATRWLDEIYEEIPFHVRRWAVASHALQIILQSCPPHPTLLYLLLEVCITHLHSSNMIPLAETLLRSLITVSFVSPSNPSAISPLPPPICHAAHTTFLTSLSSLWCNSDFGDSETFLSILLDVSVYGTSEAWTSKAVSNLAKELSKDTFNSLVRMATRLIEVIAQSKHKTSKVDKQPTERRTTLLLRWLQQIFDRLVYTDYVESDTELCLRCLELISVYFEGDLGPRLLTGGGKPANETDSMMISITAWFLAVFPPAFSPVEDARRLIRYLQSSNARPNVFTPLITRFFGSVSDDEVPWDMLNQLHSFASALNSNELYQLELSMVKQILEEFQSVFEVTLGYEPEYGQIMRDLQESINNAEAAITIIGPRNARASSNQLTSPSVTPLTHRRRYLPLPQSSFRSPTQARRRNSSPSPHHPRSRSQSPPPSSPISSNSKSRTSTSPTSNEQQSIPPPPKFSYTSSLPPVSHTPLPKKRKHMAVFVELTPWVVKKRRMFAQGQPRTPRSLRAPFGDYTHSPVLDMQKRDSRTRTTMYPPDRPVRVVDRERHSSADTASSCSPTSSRTRLIASRRYNRAPSPSPVPCDGEDYVSETSEESSGSEAEGEFDHDEEDEDESAEMSVVLPTSDDPLNLFALPDSSPRVRVVYNKKPRLCSRLRLSP